MKRDDCCEKVTSNILLVSLFFMLFVFFIPPARASFDDCAVDWNQFSSPGFISGYTYKGQLIRDTESTGTGGDTTHGQANVPPSQTDLASGVSGSSNPGAYTTPYFGYYDGGTQYDPDNPSTMQDDVIFFRMRVSSDPSKTDGFDNYHWNVLLDVDGDGYKEYWIDLEGKYSANGYDRLNILYDNRNGQDIPDPDAPGVRVDYFRAYNRENGSEPGDTSCTGPVGSPGRSHTRSYKTPDATDDYWIEIQVPMTAFKDGYGNQVLFPDSPVAFVFSTGASANDPLQKDWMMDLNFLSNADPITFGDIVYPNGKPVIEFTDSSMNFVNFCTVGDRIYVYVTDPFSNTGSIDTIQVTVSDPTTGDDETITLTETSAGSGIFANTTGGLSTTASGSGDNSGVLTIASGDTVYVTYTNPKYQTATDQAAVVGQCEAFIQFTRANGLPTDNFILTNNPNTSDELYVTVTNYAANTNSGTVQTITVTLSGLDSQTITLTETGNNTGVFRNINGLQTKISDGTVTPNDNLWEDVDSGMVTAGYSYTCGGQPYTRTNAANIFATPAGGRVYFTNQAGTQDIDLYAPGQPIYLKVEDATACSVSGGLTVSVSSSSGDVENVTLTETFSGSGVYMNASPLMIAAGPPSPDGILNASDGDTLTVTYQDCNDGDNEPSNNNKTDAATFNSPSILVNEVLFWPDPVTCQTEYIQLYNSSTQAVNVTGYRLTDKNTFSYTIPQMDGSDIILGSGKKLYISFYDVVPLNRYDDATGTYYLFTQAVNPAAYPSDELGDPGYANTADRNDLLSLYNSSDVIVDFISWSANLNPSIEFLSGFYAAVSRGIWQDGAFVNVNDMTIGQGMSRSSDGFDTNTPSDWTVISAPIGACTYLITHAVLSSFTARKEGDQMAVQWETASEVGTAGFHLLRLDKVSGDYKQINKLLLPGLISSPQGGTYRLIDNGASPDDSNRYMLVEVESGGRQRTFGPFAFDGDGQQVDFQYTGKQAQSAGEYGQGMSVEASVSDFSREAHKVSLADDAGSGGASRKAPGTLKRSERAKIAIRESGLYHLTSSEISTVLGLSEQTVRSMIKDRRVSLSNQGQGVAYRVDEDNSGIYFYALGINSIYTRDNIYWLKGERGLEMEAAEGKGPSPVAGEATFGEAVHFEENHYDAPSLTSDPSADYWFWDYAVSGFPGMESKTFTLRTDGVASTAEAVLLTVDLQGITDTPADPDHHAVFVLNGNKIGESFWDGAGGHRVDLSFSQGLLREGDNVLEVTGALDTGAEYSIFFVNSFDLKYRRLYKAVDDKLLFRGDTNEVVTVSGFAGPDILLFEVSDPRVPRLVKTTTVDGAGGDYRLTFSPAAGDAVYFATARNAAMPVGTLEPEATSSRLRQKNIYADYLVITAREFKETAFLLAVYRQNRGLAPKVVTVDEIMDEFNYGIYDPGAIRDFLSYAYSNWGKPPRYVALAGDGTYDYKDYAGYGGNPVPPIMVATPDGLFPSDGFYADVNNDGLPEMAVGRLPVKSAGELRDLIQKIIAYEKSGGSWEKRVLLLADKPDEGGDFPSESDEVASLLPPKYSPVKIYLTEHPLGEARWLVLNGINSGAVFLNFIGHGGVDRLTQDGLLVTDDVNSMTNAQGLPVVSAMTCVMGQFGLPGYDSLGEALVMKKNGGAIAVWAPTGLSADKGAVILDKALFGNVFSEGRQVLGDAILGSLQNYRGAGGETYMIDIYNLLGDPALSMRGQMTNEHGR